MAGVKLSELVSGDRMIAVPFQGTTIKVTYRLADRTPEKLDAWDVTETIVKTIKRLVVSWDILAANGKPIPVTDAGIKKVPVPVLRAIFYGVMGDDGLGEVSSHSSSGS